MCIRNTLIVLAFTASLSIAGNSRAEPAAAPVHAPANKGALGSGIKVNGYWRIDIRNPDGSLAAHREFENSLVTGPGPVTSNGTAPGGDWFLTQLLAGGFGNINGTPIGGSIYNLQNALANPATLAGELYIPFLYIQVNSFIPAVQTRLVSISDVGPIFELGPNPVNSANPCGVQLCSGKTIQTFGNSPNGGARNMINLSTSFTATTPAAITDVETYGTFAAIPLSSSVVVTSSQIFDGTVASTFTKATLNDCSSVNQPPCQVPVQAQQTIAVNVQITFN